MSGDPIRVLHIITRMSVGGAQENTLLTVVFHEYQPWLVNRSWWAAKKLCAPMTDQFISVSSLISAKAVAAGIAPPEKFTTIYSGMELDWFLKSNADPLAVRREFGI